MDLQAHNGVGGQKRVEPGVYETSLFGGVTVAGFTV